MYNFIVICIFFAISYVDCCSVGFVQYQDKCYFFSHTKTSWSDAGNICQQFHTKLAEPRTVGSSQFLSSHSMSAGKTFWIGISDILEEHRWIYSSDMGAITVNNFAPSEPDEYTSQNCVAIYDGHHGKWADHSCNNDNYFICEENSGSKNLEVLG